MVKLTKLDIFTSSRFWTIVGNTFTFTFWSVGLTLVIGLGLALLLNQPLRYRDSARAVLFSPTVMSGSVVAVVWSYIFDPRYGLIRELLNWVGLASPDWLGSPAWAMPAVIIVYVWKTSLRLGWASCRRPKTLAAQQGVRA